jgi:PII-like signaling protein
MITTLEGTATRMTIYLNDGDRSGHKALFSEIVHRAHEHGLAGASVLHGIEGYGAAGFVHTDRLLDSADDLPAVIIVVDADDKIRGFLPQLDELISDGLVTLEPVEVVRYTGAGANTTS